MPLRYLIEGVGGWGLAAQLQAVGLTPDRPMRHRNAGAGHVQPALGACGDGGPAGARSV